MSEERRLLGGRYRIEATLGRGGMAQVYRGTDTVLNRTVAIKVLAPQYAADEGFVERFRREAQSAARLNHPNVVSVYDTGSDPPVHYIVMEYVPGRTVAEVLRSEGRLQPERAAEVAAQVASALSFAHAGGIVHRDVKPGNIMLTPSGEVKVMDFGIARAASTDTLTATATVLGTASYLSPEQAQGEPTDARSDIYSLGIVLYEMLTGEVPFQADSPVAVAYKHVRESPPRPSRVVPDVPPDLEAIVLKAMAKNPANRFADASEMRGDLERYLGGRPVLATPVLEPEETQMFTRTHERTAVLPPDIEPESERRRRRVWLAVLVGVVLAALLGVLLYFLAKSLIGPSHATVRVPRVVGLNIQAAEFKLQAAGLKPVVKVKASTKPQDQVLSQSPDPGTQVASGSKIRLVVSGGQKQVKVPDITNQTPAQARTSLAGVGLHLGHQLAQSSSDTVSQGDIISEDPPAGTSVNVGTPVNYVISTGPQPVVVPDVTCMTVASAERKLQKLGLTPQDAGTDPNGPNLNCADPNKVSRSDPSAGNSVTPGTTVKLYRSAAPPSPSPSPTPSAGPTTVIPT